MPNLVLPTARDRRSSVDRRGSVEGYSRRSSVDGRRSVDGSVFSLAEEAHGYSCTRRRRRRRKSCNLAPGQNAHGWTAGRYTEDELAAPWPSTSRQAAKLSLDKPRPPHLICRVLTPRHTDYGSPRAMTQTRTSTDYSPSSNETRQRSALVRHHTPKHTPNLMTKWP
ncbi:hypothetical protein T492DRAFT_532946 [Pavlovales sp. CCMP2436]|nr:hypothetical protein T492DRAFT_532946 [Pavlovales sp. CCMP2436]